MPCLHRALSHAVSTDEAYCFRSIAGRGHASTVRAYLRGSGPGEPDFKWMTMTVSTTFGRLRFVGSIAPQALDLRHFRAFGTAFAWLFSEAWVTGRIARSLKDSQSVTICLISISFRR